METCVGMANMLGMASRPEFFAHLVREFSIFAYVGNRKNFTDCDMHQIWVRKDQLLFDQMIGSPLHILLT